MYSLLPILVFLATANAVAIDRTGAQAGAVEKRGCLVDPLGILGLCGGAAPTTTSAKASSTSSSSSSSSSSKATTSSSTSVSVSVSTSTSSSSVKPTTTTSVAQSSTSTAGNIVQTVASVPVAVVSQVLTCPLDPLGVLGLCGNGNATPASSTVAQSSSTSKATASASSSSASASSSASTGNIVSSIIAVPSSVVSQAASIVNPVVSSAVAVPSAVVSSAASAINPVVSSAVAVPSAVLSSAASVINPVVSSVSSVIAPSSSASSASSIVIAPSSAASSISSIIASVSASSAQASSSSAVVSVAPTTTSTSTSTAPSATPTPSNAAVSGWKYANCVAEGTSGRALTGSTFAGSSMTVESCLASCDAAGFPLAGLEYSSECYCGSSLQNGASLSKTGTCAMTCSGSPSEICGGSATLSLYVSTKSNAAGLNSDLTTQSVALPAGWSSTTCMQEVSGRAFTKKSTASDDMTIQKCLAFCGDSKYAGIEYGRECYCADTLSNGASLSSTSGQCVTPCAGSASTTCGGPNALQVYTNSNFKASSSGAYSNTGCVQEVDGRLLRGASIAGDNMTIETCTNFCQSQGFSISGLEYGRECYCGNSYVSTPLSSGQCNMPCAGNGAENCGGPNALNIFTLA